MDAAINGADYNSDYNARNPDPYDTNNANPNSLQNPDLSYLDTNVSLAWNMWFNFFLNDYVIISIMMSHVVYALSFYGSKIILDRSNHFGRILIILDGSNSF